MPKGTRPIRQAATIAIRDGQICMVTSRRGKDWLVPKGTIKIGTTARETALQEAWEEAGLVGHLQHEPLQTYLYKKSGRMFHVVVFAMDVVQVARNWPERGFRHRRWTTSEEAAATIKHSELRDAILATAGPTAPDEMAQVRSLIEELLTTGNSRQQQGLGDWSFRWEKCGDETRFNVVLKSSAARSRVESTISAIDIQNDASALQTETDQPPGGQVPADQQAASKLGEAA